MNIESFLVDFFSAHDCSVNKADKDLTIQLTKEMDQAIMNRPFYWHFMKQTKQEGVPLTLYLTTDSEEPKKDYEVIHFGSPRLQQIFSYLQQNYKFTRLYEQIDVKKSTPLYPWMVVNLQVDYKGQFQKSNIYSIGLNLMNGQMLTNMMSILEKLKLDEEIPHFCYGISPLIKEMSGFKRVEDTVIRFIQNEEHAWAEASINEMKKEITQLRDYFHEMDKHDHSFLEQEILAIQKRFEPKIKLKYINAGIVYTEKQQLN